MFCQKGMQQEHQSNSQFGTTAVKGIAKTERAFRPLGITQIQAKKK